ncbi:hypothetical protein [Hydrogenophaga sp. PAMC20947]|uniref:hypothetical protein n=1 Tax=Hydrogenophaga sp. PAMC20947 TaxID=2565558 RepID=UPI00109DDD38|nr:hypothetical protein [Hydrogenophaga sp. PAMC20947]QCB45430.1 hypothetical protein E5678_04955 [Hydrogenophaga sp. PAMC20947]
MKDSEQHLPRITSSNGDTELNRTQGEGPYYVMLPCEIKDFEKFVGGLLGKPQELRGEVAGGFKIGPSAITNVYHLLVQRMAKQNDASLIYFGITVYYDDGQSVVHNNLNDFESFHPTTQCHPTAVKISATYLIKFRGHDAPEKQEIEVTFASMGGFSELPRKFFFRGPYFDFRIVHTERTWATDIAGLLKNHASTVLNSPTAFEKFFNRNADNLVLYFSYIVFFCSIAIWTGFGIDKVIATTAELKSIKDTSIFFVKSVPALALLGITVMMIKTYVQGAVFFIRRGHIVFTEHDRERYEKVKNEPRWGITRYAVVWVSSLVTSVLANILYSKNLFW